jgi:hypothetical protein
MAYAVLVRDKGIFDEKITFVLPAFSHPAEYKLSEENWRMAELIWQDVRCKFPLCVWHGVLPVRARRD